MLRYGIRRALACPRTTVSCRPCDRRTSTSTTATTGDAHLNRVQTFLDPNVQNLLKQLTGKDSTRIFRNRKIGQKLREPKISFMTEEDLKETLRETEERANYLLQMPPVLQPKKYEEKVLSFDPRIQDHDQSAFVFTDISTNSSNRDRLIVIRDLDGSLRHADPMVRMKMNNIYFPSEARALTIPKMFTDPSVLKSVLERASPSDNTYEFILDRACVQFDPDDAQYVSVVEATYEHVDEMKDYDFLKSTRHYGPLVFHLTRTRKMDNLLLFNIQTERISSDAVPLVSLFTMIFPECKSRRKIEGTADDLEKLRHYIQMDAIRRSELELCLNAYEEIKRSREEVEEGLEKAHGF